MSVLDFTFSNTTISHFFKTGYEPPVNELLYLHSHPLVKPNFINQLEDLAINIGKELEAKKITSGYIVDKLVEITITTGRCLDDLTKDEQTPITLLLAMRDLYLIGTQMGLIVLV